jgi:hypothetical protein
MDNDFRNGTERSGPHAGTIVWGVICTAVGLLVLAGLWWHLSLNLGYVLIAILIGSGLALLAAGILSAVRSKNSTGQNTESRS